LSDAQTADRIDWEVRWNKYLGQQITDAHLEAYFQSHRREFDGSEVRVSHILLPGDVLGEATLKKSLIDKAAMVRRDIVDGKLTFAAAAQQYSQGPSGRSGGDLGYLQRQGPMVKSFTEAAFALKPEEISEPVVTSFGVHLIQCTDLRAGTKTWTDVRAALSEAYARDLFRRLAAEMRPRVQIEYNPTVPHLDPKTGELVGH
jgi:peptidyl-prolyl cis-trans isomerase SurA